MKTAFITGATSGIGMEFARVFASEGYSLILTGRRTERLQALREQLSVECRIITADLAEEARCRSLLDELSDAQIDVFINNAGFGAVGSFLETDPDKELSMIKVNDIAMHVLFKGVLRKMQAQGHGTILNVASSAGLLPGGPYMAGYYASKAYVVSLTRAVATELKELGSGVYTYEYATETNLHLAKYSLEMPLRILMEHPIGKPMLSQYAPEMADNPMIQYVIDEPITALLSYAPQIQPLFEAIIGAMNAAEE